MNIPMRLSTVVDPSGHQVYLEHVRMTERHIHIHRSPYACSQGEGACTPSGDISEVPNDGTSFTCLDYVERRVQGPNGNEIIYT